MGLLKEQTSFSASSARQSISSCPQLLPPFTCDAGNLLPMETAWFCLVFFSVVLLSVRLCSYSVPNEHFVLSFCDFSVFVGERNMFPPRSHPYEAYSSKDNPNRRQGAGYV